MTTRPDATGGPGTEVGGARVRTWRLRRWAGSTAGPAVAALGPATIPSPRPASERYPDLPAAAGRLRTLLVAMAGLVALLVASCAVGVVVTTPGPLGLLAPADTSSVPSAVSGTDGLVPGGPAGTVQLAVTNPTATTVTVVAADVDLGTLPAACPAAEWTVGRPPGLPTLRPGADGTVPLPVALGAQAPQSCQGRVVSWSARLTATDTGGRTVHLDAVGGIATATLGSPGVSAQVRDGRVVVTPLAPAGGPVPSTYQVEVLVDGGPGRVLCTSSAPGDCVDPQTPAGTERQYVVTAVLGSGWRRTSAAISLDGTER